MSENHKDVKSQELQRHHSDLYAQGNSGVRSSDQEHGSSHHMHMHNMHMPGQIDDVHGDAQMNSGDASAHMQLQYVPDHGHSLHHNNESGIDDDHDDGGSDGMDGDVPSDAANLAISAIPPRVQGSNQLTLSFQGEVYVFDSVSPEKVSSLWHRRESHTYDASWACRAKNIVQCMWTHVGEQGNFEGSFQEYSCSTAEPTGKFQ